MTLRFAFQLGEATIARLYMDDRRCEVEGCEASPAALLANEHGVPIQRCEKHFQPHFTAWQWPKLKEAEPTTKEEEQLLFGGYSPRRQYLLYLSRRRERALKGKAPR